MSDDKTEEIKRNILSPAAWIRILYMAFYAVACWVLLFVLPVIVICQIIISLITGVDNRNLRDFGKALSDYFHEALNYLVYYTDDKPWPFTDGADLGESFDDDDDEDDDDEEDEEDEEDTIKDEPASRPPRAAPGDDVFSDISFTGDDRGGVSGEDSDDVPETGSDADSREDDDSGDSSDSDKKDPV